MPRLTGKPEAPPDTELSELAANYVESKFGSLPTFPRKHVLADKGCCFMISAPLMKFSFVLDYLLNIARLGRQSSWFWQVELVGIRQLRGAVIFSCGAVLRKVSP